MSDPKPEQLVEAAAVVLLGVVLTTAVAAAPATISFVLPYGSFSYDETLALLQICSGVLLIFILVVFAAQATSASGEPSDSGKEQKTVQKP